ncbi:MAG: glycoside hydrolase family 3 C-terminal domain-containing protein [Oscillospiraceae bacterium]|nr:glycoside hydrolase family 3 C-terminal domain-containing protein [Oscillospiraceae bacterium]
MNYTLDWNHYLRTAAQAAAEGIVMLRNENHALPLPKNEEVAVFGRIQLHYYKSGTGSGGMVNVSKVTGILDGLLEAGVPVNQKLLDIYKAWDAANPFNTGTGWGAEPWSQKEMPLTEEIVKEAAASSRTALVIIGRTAGEEQDNRMEEGSFLLTQTETEMLRLTRAHFGRVVVLLNTGNIMDMSFVEEYHPDAVLYVWQGGMVGGTGTAMVLTGAVSPSGKLPDTIAHHIRDYPSHANFGGRDGNCYAEDIYVGYRYFETFAKEKVLYPFGFGLSYTTFSIQAEPASPSELTVTVTNTGNYDGKEVVQLYCEAPQGKLGKPLRVLIGFAKTRTLAPAESETLRIVYKLPLSYDDSGVTEHRFCYVLESGDYKLYVGSDVRSAVYVTTDHLPETRIERQCRQAMAPVTAFRRIKPAADGDAFRVEYEDVPLNAVDEVQRRLEALPSPLPPAERAVTFADVYEGRATAEELVSTFTDDELCAIARGEGMNSPRVTPGTASAFGGVCDSLEARGIPACCCSDGPSGMRLDCGTKAFSLPNGTMLASTFNRPLLRELFFDVGMEMTANQVDCLLGPGMNIHRHPLNGRNFEYFSEDPYLTGQLAAAELQGLHQAGVEGTVKHCCGNNQETRRHFYDSVVSERALREIYLHGFEIAVKEGGAKSIMTTYGAVNGLWTAGNADLCTEILRNEWGFDGFLMTDWWTHVNDRGQEADRSNHAAMVRAQNDVYMVCADCLTEADNIASALADGTLIRGELQRNALNVLRFVLKTHAAERKTGNPAQVEILNRPKEESESVGDVQFCDLTDDLTLPMDGICTDKGMTYAFGLTVLQPGWYRVTLTGSAEGGELAQVPMTMFSMGTANGTFTWRGNGISTSFRKKIPMFSHFTTFRLFFAQSGLHLESVRFELVQPGMKVELLTENDDES